MGRELRSAGKLTVNCGVWARAGKVASAAQTRRPRREVSLGMRMSLARRQEVQRFSSSARALAAQAGKLSDHV